MATTTEQAVKERPVIFSVPMVQAILDGRKTQTRRKVMHQGLPLADFAFYEVDGDEIRDEDGRLKRCRHGKPGDRLWVKETWMPVDLSFRVPANVVFKVDDKGRRHAVVYRADVDYHADWNNAMFMPRWASRITLEITRVRVQRIQDISSSDAQAEGVDTGSLDPARSASRTKWVSRYHALWDQIHGAGAWDRNDWVWCLTFKRV